VLTETDYFDWSDKLLRFIAGASFLRSLPSVEMTYKLGDTLSKPNQEIC